MLLGLIIIIYQEKLTNFPLKNEFLVPNKRAGRNFSSKLINVQFLSGGGGIHPTLRRLAAISQGMIQMFSNFLTFSRMMLGPR